MSFSVHLILPPISISIWKGRKVEDEMGFLLWPFGVSIAMSFLFSSKDVRRVLTDSLLIKKSWCWKGEESHHEFFLFHLLEIDWFLEYWMTICKRCFLRRSTIKFQIVIYQMLLPFLQSIFTSLYIALRQTFIISMMNSIESDWCLFWKSVWIRICFFWWSKL